MFKNKIFTILAQLFHSNNTEGLRSRKIMAYLQYFYFLIFSNYKNHYSVKVTVFVK